MQRWGPSPYLLQCIHLGGQLVDVGMYFHQIHAVQGTLQEIHHRLQLEVVGGAGRQMVKQGYEHSSQRAQKELHYSKKPQDPRASQWSLGH